MTDFTKTRATDLRSKLREMKAGDVLTVYQARDIGWMTFREHNLECVDHDTGKRGKFVKLQPLTIEISGCTSWGAN